jgi:putative transposase
VAQGLLLGGSMSKPREILENQHYLISRRCTQRQCLLRPDSETNNAFIYCLAIAAERTTIEVVLTLAEANHHHTVIFDRYGNCPAFVEYFHKLFARSQNVLRGRCENFWSAGAPCITRLLDPATVIAKLVYTATNPVKDRLVERVHHWPGVNGYRNLMSDRPLTARRPRHFFRNPGPMPESVSLRLIIPPELGERAVVLEQLRAGVEETERAVAEERKRTGARVLGRRAVLAQSWRAVPTSIAPRRNLRPRFAGALENRIAALSSYQAFQAAYRDARERWLANRPSAFPIGTYWLARFAAVPIVSHA